MTTDAFLRYNKIQELLTKSFACIVLNLSTDSFSGDGVVSLSELDQRIKTIVESGAQCIDIGAQSTKRGAVQMAVSDEEEKIRTTVSLVREQSPSIIISIDTTRASVAKVGIACGADIINDISGGQFDDEMYNLILAHPHIMYVIGHTQGTFQSMHAPYTYLDIVGDLISYANTKISFLEGRGIRRERIIFDPCIGFSKAKKENLAIIQGGERLVKEISVPIFIGLSRKGFIKSITGQEDNSSLDRYTLALYAILVSQGVKVIRTHEVTHTLHMLTLLHQLYEQ